MGDLLHEILRVAHYCLLAHVIIICRQDMKVVYQCMQKKN